MNYKEFNDFCSKNWDVVSPGIKSTNPIHEIMACIAAPANSTYTILQEIYHEIADKQQANENVLWDKGLIGTNLAPYIVYRSAGLFTILSFKDYASIEWAPDNRGENDV